MALTAFGPRAESYAARLPAALEAIVFDELGFAEALAEALERASRGDPFFAFPIIAHRRSAAALAAVPELLAPEAHWERRRRIEVLADLVPPEWTRKERDSMRDVLLASDAVVTRSWSELAELARLLEFRPTRSTRAVARPALGLSWCAPARDAQRIVIWAPGLVTEQAALFPFALEELRAPVTMLCGDLGAMNSVLAEAAVVIDASPDDPAPAIEFAALGVPLAAAFSSGAHEYVDNLYHYDHWDARSILQAALAALGGEPPVLRAEIPRAEELASPKAWVIAPATADAQLASVIIPTRDRHSILPRAVDSVAAQRYPNVELILVNDGGAPVDDIASRYQHARVVNLRESSGVTAAMNAGLAAARGEFVTLIGDDDYLFPDHLTRLVHALERTGAAVALGMVMCSYLQPGADGEYDLFGMALEQVAAIDPTELRRGVYGVIGTSLLARRAAIAEIGGFDPQAGHGSDFDLYLSLIERHDWIFVPHVLANFDVRMDDSNVHREHAGEAARLLRYIFAKHPTDGRPDIESMRSKVLEYSEGDAPRPYPQRGITRLAKPRRGIYQL